MSLQVTLTFHPSLHWRHWYVYWNICRLLYFQLCSPLNYQAAQPLLVFFFFNVRSDVDCLNIFPILTENISLSFQFQVKSPLNQNSKLFSSQSSWYTFFQRHFITSRWNSRIYAVLLCFSQVKEEGFVCVCMCICCSSVCPFIYHLSIYLST